MKDNDFTFAGGYEHIPDGTYEAIATRYDCAEFYQREKLYIWFRVVSTGSHEGKELFMAFNVFRKITKSSKYYQAWVLANKGAKPRKNERISPKIFKNKIFTIKTRTVVSDKKQTELSKDDRYSIVEELLDVCVG